MAFASAVGDELPVMSAVLRPLALAVAYSRVHTGVHYPGDVVVGSLVGSAAALVVRQLGPVLARRTSGV
jgi:undecaprenyl-diphosphatase